MLAGIMSPAGYAFRTRELIDSLQKELPKCKTPEDSIRVLYDIMDTNDGPALEMKTGKMLLNIATRLDKQNIIRDIIPRIAVMAKKDSVEISKLLRATDMIKRERDRKAIRVFIKVMRASAEANYMPQDKLREVILKYADEDMTPKDDIYEDILDLYLTVIFLGNTTNGNLYIEYLDRLDKLISRIPEDQHYLRSLYYTTAANCHTRNNNYERAIECDRELLKMISNLEQQFHEDGRIYRNYDRNRYVSYRRMLSNYHGLTKDEINDLYSKCSHIADINASVNKDFNTTYGPAIYRHMAEGNYRAAIPLIKKSLESNSDNYRRRKLLDMLITAADSVGDEKVENDAYVEYNALLKEQLMQQSVEASRELQIRYDVNSLRNEKEKAEIEKRELEIRTSQIIIIVALIALLILAVLLMVLYRSNFNLRNRIKDQLVENKKLNTLIEGMLSEADNIAGTHDARKSRKE